jgi:acyl-CoA dehydrogenase family protein 9
MIQRKFASAAADCYASDAAWMVTSAMVDRGGVDFSLETACCKIFASELANRTAHETLQIAGGIGYSKEYPYEQFVRDARINMIFEGTNEILRALIALSALQEPGERLKQIGKAFKDPLRSIGAISGYIAGRAKKQMVKPEFSKVHAALKAEADMVAEVVQDLALGVEGVLMAEGKTIIEKQFHQERLANAAIDIYMAVCALSRATAALESAGGDEAKAAPDLDCARLFVASASRRARRAVRGLSRNQDERQKAVAQRAMESAELCPDVPIG